MIAIFHFFPQFITNHSPRGGGLIQKNLHPWICSTVCLIYTLIRTTAEAVKAEEEAPEETIEPWLKAPAPGGNKS